MSLRSKPLKLVDELKIALAPDAGSSAAQAGLAATLIVFLGACRASRYNGRDTFNVKPSSNR
jgi:hypothetical protein